MLKIICNTILIILTTYSLFPQGAKYEVEPNNSTASANIIGYNDTLIASITPIGDVDYFKYTSSILDTIIINVKVIENSQLSLSYEISGSIISYGSSNESLYLILNGTIYIKCYSSTILRDIETNNKTINGISLSKNKANSVSATFSNNYLKIANANKALNDNTGKYQIILSKFTHVPVISTYTDFKNADKYCNAIFDESWNKVRTRVLFYPNGKNTTVQWEYGKDSSYGFIKKNPDTFDGLKELSAISYLPNLEPNAIYHYRVHLSNPWGDAYSKDYTFKTSKVPDKNITRVSSGKLMNYADTSYVSDAGIGGGWRNIFNFVDLQSISFKDKQNGLISGNYLGYYKYSNDYYHSYVFLSTSDGGYSWQEKTNNIIESNAPYSNARISFTNESKGIFLGERSDIYIFGTTDGGNSWMQKCKLKTFLLMSNDGPDGNMFFTNASQGTVVGFGSIDSVNPNSNSNILQTSDGGITWLQKNQNMSGEFNIFSDVFFTDQLNGIIIGKYYEKNNGVFDNENVILKTADGGNSWNKQKCSINLTYFLKAVYFSDKLHGTIVGSDISNYPNVSGLILRTTDSGITWERQSNGLDNINADFISVKYSDSLNGLIAGKSGVILKTTDGGNTWNKIESGTNNDLHNIIIMGNRFYAIGDWGTILVGDLLTSTEDQNVLLPNRNELLPNHPNPFNPSTTINYSIEKAIKVLIVVYDILGREIATLVNEEKTAGKHSVIFNASGLTSGIYFYRISTGKFTKTQKMVFVK